MDALDEDAAGARPAAERLARVEQRGLRLGGRVVIAHNLGQHVLQVDFRTRAFLRKQTLSPGEPTV